MSRKFCSTCGAPSGTSCDCSERKLTSPLKIIATIRQLEGEVVELKDQVRVLSPKIITEEVSMMEKTLSDNRALKEEVERLKGVLRDIEQFGFKNIGYGYSCATKAKIGLV